MGRITIDVPLLLPYNEIPFVMEAFYDVVNNAATRALMLQQNPCALVGNVSHCYSVVISNLGSTYARDFEIEKVVNYFEVLIRCAI